MHQVRVYMHRRIFPLAVALALSCTFLRAEEKPAPPPPQVRLALVRYDLPRGFDDGFAPTRQPAVRKEGADPVDWPALTLNGKPLWAEGSEATVPLTVRGASEAGSPFRLPTDDVIQPGGHWLRFVEWPRGRTHAYTGDRSARTAGSGPVGSGAYELWAFPIVIRGEGGPVVKNVELKIDGRSIYRKNGPWRSLTLLLPANERSHPYELTVDGRGPVKFEAGLAPVKLGDPRERVIPLNAMLPGDGPKISVKNLARPEEFPNPKEWAADLATLARPAPPAAPIVRGTGLARYLGAEVAVSPLTIYAAGLPRGQSGGFFKKGDAVETYAKTLAAAGYDTIFEPVATLPASTEKESFEVRAAAFARTGLRLGFQYDQNLTRPNFSHPNLALFAHTLPDWHAPLYRSISLAAQRFARWPNFAGFNVGADHAGYASIFPTAPPGPDRPWGEAMIEFAGSPQPRVPRAPSLGAPELPFEQVAKTQDDFLKYISRYDLTFRQYGYFAEAVREVSPRLVFTTASFCNAAGAGARGGWPGASISGREIFEGLTTQQAYDLNETHAARPLLNTALIDRLRSYRPQLKTWALLDNNRFLYGREGWQRACALALSRGIQGLGTNFLAAPDGDSSEVVAWQGEMNAWSRKFGGVFARTEPAAVVGVFYGHHQATLRRVIPDNATPAQLALGSHEGKVTEALFICHAAGWPARVITFQELLRGSLPTSMKAILLVGLDQPDSTWSWATGIEPALQQFLADGGRILTDDESVCPVPSKPTGMKVAAYVGSGALDATPQLFSRNTENIVKLNDAMDGVAEPVAVSEEPTVWAIPTQAADTQYVTVVNQASADSADAATMLRPADPRASKPEVWKTKANASLYVKPQRADLRWNTERPIYDVRLGRKLTPEQAAVVDLTRDAFQWYALPPAEVVAPKLSVSAGVSGFFEARATIQNGPRMDGIPVEFVVAGGGETVSVFGATGQAVRLPLNQRNERGDFTITARELLTGLSSETKLHIEPPPAQPVVASAVWVRDPATVTRFARRKQIPLTIALTAEQQKDATILGQAQLLADFYRKQGRPATRVGLAGPAGIVESLQVLRSPHRYPQWQTAPTDLVLFGSPADNVLLLDQSRAEIFPAGLAKPKPGQATVVYTRSPFVGECDAVNVIASDAAGITAAVQALVAGARTAGR